MNNLVNILWIFIFAISLGVYPNISHAEVVEEVLVVVNGEAILLSDLHKLKRNLKNETLVFEEVLQLKDVNKLKKQKQAQINHLIDTKIIDSEVKRQGLQVTTEKVEKEIQKITRSKGITVDELKGILLQNNIQFSEYKKFVQLSIPRKELIEKEVISRIKISDEEISTYYISQTGQGEGQVFEYKLAHILFSPQKPGGHKAAKSRAQKVHKIFQKKKNTDFVQLASQYSEDPYFSNEGLLGQFTSEDMLPTLKKSVRNLLVGGVSGVVKTGAGYHIVKLLKKTLVVDPELQRQRDQIHRILMARAFKRELSRWIERKRKESFIKINE